MKEKILAYLRKEDGFVSGQTLCEEIGVSRTAIWKYMKALKKDGYEIESVTRKGYRLLRSPNVLTREEILCCLPRGLFAGEIHFFPSVDSTNEAARRAALSGAPGESLFVADTQTAGRGRRGRTWSSPGGEDLFFSILLRPDILPEHASMLTIIAALAAAAAAAKHSKEVCKIKWPNDVVLHDRKICGILTEMGVEMDEISYVIVGVGFNLNRMDFSDPATRIGTSIRKETGLTVNRAAFLADFSREFMDRYRRFIPAESLAAFMDEYNELLINTGRQVKLLRREDEIIRKACGINEKGELIVEDEHGVKETVLSGEVSVRGLYGYT